MHPELDEILRQIADELTPASVFLGNYGQDVTLCCDENLVRGLFRRCSAMSGYPARYGRGKSAEEESEWYLSIDRMSGKLCEKTVPLCKGSVHLHGGNDSNDLGIDFSRDTLHLEIKVFSDTGGKSLVVDKKGVLKDIWRVEDYPEYVRLLYLLDESVSKNFYGFWPLVGLDNGLVFWQKDAFPLGLIEVRDIEWSVAIIQWPSISPYKGEAILVPDFLSAQPGSYGVVAASRILVDQSPGSNGPKERLVFWAKKLDIWASDFLLLGEY